MKQGSARPQQDAPGHGILGTSTLTGAVIGVLLAVGLVAVNVTVSGVASLLDALNALAASSVLLFPYLLVLLVPLLALDGLLTAVVLQRRARSNRSVSLPRYAVTLACFGTASIALILPVLVGIVRSPLSVQVWLGGAALTFSILFVLGAIAGRSVLSRVRSPLEG